MHFITKNSAQLAHDPTLRGHKNMSLIRVDIDLNTNAAIGLINLKIQ